MKIVYQILGAAILLLAAAAILLPKEKVGPQPEITNNVPLISKMKISSPVFSHNGKLPSQYTCDGKGINPPLQISETPREAKSLVLILDDPDATIGTFTHWTVWNIDPQTQEIGENSAPIGSVEGANSLNKKGYISPCPPSGIHRYIFKLYALDAILDLAPKTSPDELKKAIKDHIIDQSELIGSYGRPQ